MKQPIRNRLVQIITVFVATAFYIQPISVTSGFLFISYKKYFKMEINQDTKFAEFQFKMVKITTRDGKQIYTGFLISFNTNSFTLRNCRIYNQRGKFKTAGHMKINISKMKNNYIDLKQNGDSVKTVSAENVIEEAEADAVSEVPEAYGAVALNSPNQDSQFINPLSPLGNEAEYFQPVINAIPTTNYYYVRPWLPPSQILIQLQYLTWVPVLLVCIVVIPPEGPN